MKRSRLRGRAAVMVDYHLHTPLCHHALGSPTEYLEKARCIGLREIGLPTTIRSVARDDRSPR